MSLNQLPSIVSRSRKRVGRGIGSGKGGHTASRGQKGQKSREKVPLTFDGTKIKKSLLKRLPVMRGKGKFKTLVNKALGINVSLLNHLPANTEVTRELLISAGLISRKTKNVKILSQGELKVALIVKLPVSLGAKNKIESAGGKVV